MDDKLVKQRKRRSTKPMRRLLRNSFRCSFVRCAFPSAGRREKHVHDSNNKFCFRCFPSFFEWNEPISRRGRTGKRISFPSRHSFSAFVNDSLHIQPNSAPSHKMVNTKTDSSYLYCSETLEFAIHPLTFALFYL